MIHDHIHDQMKLDASHCGGRKNWHMALLTMGIFTMLASGIPLLCYLVERL